MKSRLHRILLFPLCLAFASAEPPGIDQSLEFVTPPAGAKFIRWHGKLGRSYFVQVSDPANHLNTWHYELIIEAGNDEDISYEVDGTAEKGFFRLKYTDQVPGPGETLDNADFDQDGIPNLYEIQTVGSDPLDKNSAGGDSDNDRLPDGWEMYRFGNLSNDGYADPDGDGYNNFEERALGSDPDSADPPFTDTDGDGLPDSYEAQHGLSSTGDDSLEDKDGENIPNIFEYKNGSSPSDPADKPPFDYIVDQLTGNQGPTDNVYSKVQQALDASNYSPWDDVNDMPGPPPRPFQLILVKSGTYRENLYMAGIPTLLTGERGNPAGPAVIAGTDGVTVHLESRSVLDSLVITHVPGQSGTGIEVQHWQMDPGDPAALSRRRLVNCIIRGNSDPYVTGGVYSGGALLTLDHCTVYSNTGPEGATGVLQSEGSLTLNNTIIWGNNAQQPATGNTQLWVTNGATLLTSATSPNIIGDPNTLSVPGWIDQTDPKLTPAGWLKFDSPAINAGGAIANTITSSDIHGELRNLDTAPDIGADEYLDTNGVNNGDGVPDWVEGPDDDDGLSALVEYQIHGTDPRIADTDGDGMNDGDEIVNGFNPLADEDLDHDGMSDAWEFIHGLDWLTDDGLDDKDGDRIPNLFEFHHVTSPVNVQGFPPVTFEVNPATGNDDPDDNIYPTLADALDATDTRDTDDDGHADPYPIILVRGGVYNEQVTLSGIPILLLGELGSSSGPAEIRPTISGNAVTMESRSVLDGFVISHQTGIAGSGLRALDAWGESSQRRRLVNCIIRGNTGGGIYVGDCELELVHCTVFGNSSSQNYPGVRLVRSVLRLRNSVVAGNTGNTFTNYRQIEVGSESSVSASETSPSFVGDLPQTATPGWITVPYPGLTPDGYLFDSYTSVVDSGGIIPATAVLYDLQGQLRSAGGVPDIGADEFIPEYTDPENSGSGSNSTVDSDGDGIPDQWEIAHNLEPQIPNPASDLQDYLNESANTTHLIIHTPLQ